MRKTINFFKIFIPAYIIAVLLYVFVQNPDFVQPVLGGQVAVEQNKIPEGKLTITIFNINHGDAILLQDSKQNILIDTGHNANRELVLKKLAAKNIKRINTVFVTHHHADHMGNIFQIAGKYGVSRIYDNGLVNFNNANSVKLGDVLGKGNYKNKRLSAGDKVSFGDGFYFDVLAPGAFMDSALRNDLNNNSIVMKMHYGNFTMMFTGDIENPTEVLLADKYGSSLKSDVLKVAHHGSKTSSNYQFVSKVKPEYALISCGDFAEYHHPNKNVVGRLQHLGAKVYNTNANGDIVITTDGKSFEVKVEKNTLAGYLLVPSASYNKDFGKIEFWEEWG